ncbi:MAG: VTT domain-containing protein [Actinobacteria bacterium]|nr:VTT domain-containing protein [Actinomycetota bacterium]
MNLLDPHHLIETFGTIGILAVVFAETGLLVGFFLPGDSLLFTAGLLASQGKLNFAVIAIGCFVAAVAGAQTGYYIGRRIGPALFRRPDSRLFKREYVDRAQAYFEEHGSRTIVLARFVPIVRTFSTVVAGVSRMEAGTFLAYNLIGGLVWTIGVTTAGYFLGKTIPSIDKYLLPIIAGIILVSLIPVLIEARRARKRSAASR